HLDALEGLIDAAGEPPLEEDRAAVDGALAAARAAAPAEAAALAHLDRLTGRALERRFALEPAAEAYARAAAAQPADLAMLAPLVALHVTWRAWPEAAAALRAFSDRYAPAAVEDADARHRCVEALMREGALWTDLAGEPARGAACFKRVRVLAPERHDAAWRQAECHVLQGDFAEARRLMRAVLAPTRAIPPADHAQALFYLGRIEALGFGDEAEAERQYRRALDVDPRHAGALLALLKGLDARGDAEGLAKALARGRSRIEAVPEGPAAAALRTFAAGLHLREGELASARALLDPMASGHGPGFRAARFALVQIHERAGDGRGALRPLLTLLDDDVTDVDALQTLAELLARQGDPERRFQVLSVLALFRALDADQRAELDRLAQGARKRHERPRPLPDDVLAHQVVHPSFNSPLVRLAGLCAPQLAARFDPGPRPILGPDTAVTRRHPFAFRLRALQVLLGVDRFQLHFEPAYGEPVGVWPGDPALVVLGGPALEAPPAEQVGHVARALFYVRSGLAGLFNLGYRRRLALFGTLDALFVPGAAEMDAAQALIDAVPDAVAAEIKRVVDATGRMTLPTAFTGEAVMAGVSASADRASLLAGGELRAAAEGLLRTAESGADVPEGDDLTWAVRSAPRLRDLVKFALSEAYGLSKYKILRPTVQKAINYLESHRNPYGVWRYQPRDNDNDT
ncbi:MAG: tetratricopeptide repeat protein, partial [Myxococcales bacterium]|nr:tetratricopeptide repeat protein [Myxococcales bacterium]